jgi:hypothetical protein
MRHGNEADAERARDDMKRFVGTLPEAVRKMFVVEE